MRTTVDKVSQLKDKTLDPRSFQFRMKHSLRKRINSLLTLSSDLGSSSKSSDKASQEVKFILDREEESKEPLSYDDVSKLHQCWQRLDVSGDFFYFCEFLDQFRAILPEARAVSTMGYERCSLLKCFLQQNKELDERLKRLSYESSNKSYHAMTRGVTRQSNNNTITGNDIQEEGQYFNYFLPKSNVISTTWS